MNDEHDQFLSTVLQAPWAGQPVRPFVRALGWLVVGLGTLSLALAAYFLAIEGIPVDDIPFIVSAFLGVLYMVLLFGRAAYTGRAPGGWLPWS